MRMSVKRPIATVVRIYVELDRHFRPAGSDLDIEMNTGGMVSVRDEQLLCWYIYLFMI